MDNFPPGAAEDKNAPYNEKNPEMIEWEALQHGDCGVCGAEALWLNEDGICEICYYLDPEYYDEEEDETPREDYE